MDFDFGRFSARSFERFAQALALRVLGPGIRLYGDGPDGGRETSYSAKFWLLVAMQCLRTRSLALTQDNVVGGAFLHRSEYNKTGDINCNTI